MTTFAWALSMLAHEMTSVLHGDDHTEVATLLIMSSPTQDMANTVLNKEDIVKELTNSIIDSVVYDVVRRSEETATIVGQSVAQMIDIFLDSTQENRDHSLENELIVNEVEEEMIDGIVSIVCKPPSEPLQVESQQIDRLKEAAGVCELIVLAMAILVMVDFFDLRYV